MKVYSPPPDKSVTLRALLLGAVAAGAARVENPLYCEDTEAALRCLEALGVRHCRDGGAVIVEGRGLKGLRRPGGPLDAGESGTLARLLCGLLAGQDFPSEITGRGSLLKRPMMPLAAALVRIGARVAAPGGRLPLRVKPARLKGGRVCGVESAQVKSALLLAGLNAAGPVEVREKFQTRDHTERLLALTGARLSRKGSVTRLEPGPLTARPVTVPGDISAAAPFIAAALLAGEPLRVENCGLNPGRIGFLLALKKLGARIEISGTASFPEPAGTVTVSPSRLKAAAFSAAEVPAMIDEVPLLAVCAAAAAGTTVLRGLEPLRGKESDRVASTLALLTSLGVKASYSRGVLRITGGKFRAAAPAETFGDHRIAMAAAAARTRCAALEIRNPGCTDKSYPGFWRDFKKVFSLSF